MTLSVLVGSLLVMNTLGAASAEAASRPRLLILRTDGNAIADKARVKLTTHLLRAARRYKHYISIASNVDLVEEMFAFECTEAGVECLARIGKKYKADRVVYSEVVRERSGVLTWSMRVVDVDAKNITASRVSQSTRQSMKTVAGAPDAARRGLVVLIGPVDLPSRDVQKPGSLVIRLVGGGVALVYANDQLLGRTSVSGLRKQVAPGKVRLKVVRAGYKEWTKVVEVRAGQTVTEVVELSPEPVAKGTGPGGKAAKAVPVTKKWWFWTAIGSAVAVGAVVIWAVTRNDDEAGKGTVGFSIDSSDAHKDPVFVSP